MTEEDHRHWNARHGAYRSPSPGGPAAPAIFAPFEDWFPTSGQALDIACGRGEATLWLAKRGMGVLGIDVSSAAVRLARERLSQADDATRARFAVHDLDGGLPDGPPVDLILCHKFRDTRLYGEMMTRLVAGGLLALATLSEVDARPGRFRARPGELPEAFADLEQLASGEGNGLAWLIARKPSGAR